MRLENGQTFPHMTFQQTSGNMLTLPDDLGDGWAAVLFYRGHW